MARFGCLLMILGVIALLAIVLLPILPFLNDSPQFDSLLQPLLCDANEHVQRNQYTSRSPGEVSFSMTVDCVGLEGEVRDVTDRWTLIGMAAFIAPFLIGLFAFIAGASRTAQQAAQTGLGRMVVQIEGMGAAPASARRSLSQQLEEVQQAYDDGLITREEYERLRQEALEAHIPDTD